MPASQSQAAKPLALAKPDAFTFTEDAFVLGDVQYLNVLANDVGGRALKIHSVDDDATPGSDLLSQDPSYASLFVVTQWEYSSLGARYAIIDGRIAYDAITSPSVSTLALGETLTDTITYAVTLPSGKLSYSTVNVTITGDNDQPFIGVNGSDSLNAVISEDSLDPEGSSITASGTLTVTDFDTSDTVTATVTNAWMGWNTGSLTPEQILPLLQLNGGTLTADWSEASNLAWSFTRDAALFDYLEDGQVLSLYYDVAITDNHGAVSTATITVNVVGTSLPADPVISVGVFDANSATIGEGSNPMFPLATSGRLTATDANLADQLTASVTGVTLSGDTGTLTSEVVSSLFQVSNHVLGRFDGNLNWSFASSNALFDYLAPGQQVSLAYSVTVADGNGGTDTEVVTINITGENETPTVSITGSDSNVAALTEEGSDIFSSDPTPLANFNGTLTVSDYEGTSLSASVISAYGSPELPFSSESLLEWFTVSIDPSQTVNNLHWSFEAHPELYQGLRAFDLANLLYTLEISDGQGGVTSQNIYIQIRGQNDPVVRFMDEGDVVSANVTEDNASASGQFMVYDVDQFEFIYTSPGSPIIEVEGNLGTLTQDDLLNFAYMGQPFSSWPPGTHTVPWFFTPTEGAFDYLNEGEEVTITYNMMVNDIAGSSLTQPFSITITGTADPMM